MSDLSWCIGLNYTLKKESTQPFQKKNDALVIRLSPVQVSFYLHFVFTCCVFVSTFSFICCVFVCSSMFKTQPLHKHVILIFELLNCAISRQQKNIQQYFRCFCKHSYLSNFSSSYKHVACTASVHQLGMTSVLF